MEPSLLALFALKGTVLLSAAFFLSWVCRRASAAARHSLWVLALALLLMLPFLEMFAPAWDLPALPAGWAAPAHRSVPPGEAGEGAAAGGRNPGDGRARPGLGTAVAFVWGAGVLLGLGRFAAGAVAVRRIIQRASRSAAWGSLLPEAARRAGCAQKVAILESGEVRVPLAWGFLHPVILVPLEAASWSAARRRLVLLHEIAHVRRRDCLIQAVTHTACCLHWFNPLAWMAARRTALERERACDDVVLKAGMPPPDYAAELVSLTRALVQRGRWPAAAIAMARPSQLEGRVRSILDGRAARGPWGTTAILLAALSLVAVVLPLAAMKPVVSPGGSSIRGTVFDPSRAVVPGAAVIAREPGTGTRAATVTDAAGRFVLAGLPAGRYQVEVRARGFRLARHAEVQVTPETARVVDTHLRLGMVTEVITVAAR